MFILKQIPNPTHHNELGRDACIQKGLQEAFSERNQTAAGKPDISSKDQEVSSNDNRVPEAERSDLQVTLYAQQNCVRVHKPFNVLAEQGAEGEFVKEDVRVPANR